MININRYTTNLSTHLRALFLMLLLGILWNCTSEDINDIPIVGGNESTVTFSVRVPGGGIPKLSSPTTYALSEDDENEIAQIAVLLFDTDGYTYQPIYVSGSNITTTPTSSNEKKFTVKVPEGTYNVVVLANANEVLKAALGSISAGSSKAVVLNQLLLTNNGKWIANPETTGYKHMPMWGEVAGEITVTANTPSSASVKLVRMLAKIDVALSTTDAKTNFNLQSVRLYNYYNKGRVAPRSIPWDGSAHVVTGPSVPYPVDGDKQKGPLLYDGNAITKEATANKRGVSCTNEIYTFETVAGSSSNFLTNTCLVVGGYYKEDTEPTYYRLDIANTTGTGRDVSTTFMALLRNHHYKINITGVKAPGKSTADEAFKSSSANIIANLISWDDARITKIAYDGQYMLGVSADEFAFYSDGRAVVNTNNTLYITTDNPLGWKVDKIVDEADNEITWLSLSPSAGISGVTTTTELVLSENTTDAERTATIHLSAGSLKYTIRVKQLAKTKLGIAITNASGEPINTLEFAARKDVVPGEQQFVLNWVPPSSRVTFTNTSIGNGFLFNTSGGFDEIPVQGAIENTLGTKTYTIQPSPITAAELASDPFYVRTSLIQYSVTEGARTANNSITLRQYAYNMVLVDVDDEYTMSGSLVSFGVRSNIPFTVSIKDNPDNVLEDLCVRSGGPNTSTKGTRVLFQLKDKEKNPNLLEQYKVVLTIKSPKGFFDDQDVILNCVSEAT